MTALAVVLAFLAGMLAGAHFAARGHTLLIDAAERERQNAEWREHRARDELAAERAAREALRQEDAAEIRRLTDLLVAMKKEGHAVPPGHGDEVWPEGRYVIDDALNLEQAELRAHREKEHDTAELDRELLAALDMDD